MHVEAVKTPQGSPLGWAALMVVYLVWGSTYLAIRIGVRDFPPLTMAGLRYVAAGLILFPIAMRSGTAEIRRSDVPRLRQWLSGALVGLLLLVFGNGGLTIAETRIDSGLAAVLVATVPLWMIVFSWPINKQRPTGRGTAGLIIGLFGITALGLTGSASGQLSGILIVLGASVSWGLGSVIAGRLWLSRRALLAAAIEMLAAGAILLVAAQFRGDIARTPWTQISADSWLALAYLIVPGSILAFTAYGYALSQLPMPTVSTYAYVNPVVAVFLGVVILSETLSTREVAGTLLVVASVILTLPRHRSRRLEKVAA